MTSRRRRGANGANSTPSSKPKSGGTKKNNRSRKSKKKQQQNFWGQPVDVEVEEELIKITSDPAAVVRSLGSPPLSGHETVAEHYFDAVYERSVGLASALAAAANLLDDDFDPTGGLERD